MYFERSIEAMSVLNQSGEEQVECPLCMEPLEVDDLNFFPCTCGYQVSENNSICSFIKQLHILYGYLLIISTRKINLVVRLYFYHMLGTIFQSNENSITKN